MHKMQCCYATFALHKQAQRTYLPIIEQHEARPNKDRLTTEVKEMNLIRNYRNWRRYRNTVEELGRLSTRELDDLGIARGDIPFVARRSV